MIYITGENGQLGQEFKHHQIFSGCNFINRSLLNLENLEELETFLKRYPVSLLINTAAFTKVDLAEDNQDLAYKINTKAPELMAHYSKKFNFKFVHYSTDYVFDSAGQSPITEDNPTSPLNFYGKSKREGELAVIRENSASLILRTSWVYSSFGHNFVKTILKKAKEGEHLRIVADQIGSPTYALDLANITKLSIDRNLSGIYHYTNEASISWYDFGVEILKQSNLQNKITPIKSNEITLKAKRPHYSVLSCEKIKVALNLKLNDWKSSLKICLNAIEHNSLS